MTAPLVRRRDACEAAIRRFKDRPFRWGREDCARMAAFTLRQLGQRTPLVKAGFYSSALGARRALKRLGFDTLEAALDDRCPRIAPAMALPGDVLGFRTDEEHADWIALGVALGNGRALTFHGEPSVGTVLALHEPAALAWRAV